MRILYGVVGEGMGHATRSRVILEHLTQAGHEVYVVASGRAHDYLKARFSEVHKIWGFTIAYENGGVGKFDTFMQNLKGAFSGWPENVKKYFELVKEFRPEVVISDFESFSYMFAKNYLLPVISIDNMQVINRCKHEPAVLAGYETDFQLTRSIVKSKLPGAYHYLITTFFYPELRKKRTSLYPSILRPEIIASKSEAGEHLLVYQTSDSVKDLGGLLKKTGRVCKVYGYKRNLKEPEVDGSVHFMPFSEEGFINDLRTCKGVVANGGFTLMSESVYLHKPFMSMPIGGQFEQILNARYLEKMNFGVHAPVLDSESLGQFLEKVPDCEKSLAAYKQDGNKAIFGAIDALLQRVAAGERPSPEEMSIQ